MNFYIFNFFNQSRYFCTAPKNNCLKFLKISTTVVIDLSFDDHDISQFWERMEAWEIFGSFQSEKYVRRRNKLYFNSEIFSIDAILVFKLTFRTKHSSHFNEVLNFKF